MHLGITSVVEKSEPVPVTIHCRSCGRQATIAAAVDRIERFKIFHVVPIGISRCTLVTCGACGVGFRSSLKATELRRYLPGEIGRFLTIHISPALIVLLIAAFLTLIVPFVSLILSSVALWMGWKHNGWIRRIALSEMGIGLVLQTVYWVTGFPK